MNVNDSELCATIEEKQEGDTNILRPKTVERQTSKINLNQTRNTTALLDANIKTLSAV